MLVNFDGHFAAPSPMEIDEYRGVDLVGIEQ